MPTTLDEFAPRRRGAKPGLEDDADPPRRRAGRLWLDRRLGASGAVAAILGFLAACVAVFVLALYATSLAF